MKPAVQWTITGVLFVAMFIGARIYLQQTLEEAQAPVTGPAVPVEPGAPPRPRREPPPPREPIDLSALSLSSDAAAFDREAAHDALEDLREESLGATLDSLELLAALPGVQAELESAGHRDVAAHVLAVRVALADGLGDADPALAEALAAWKAKEPASFAWMPEEQPVVHEEPTKGEGSGAE